MGDKKITIGAPHDILLTKRARFFTIRETEWSRLKRLIEICKFGVEWWSVAASVLFGISGSASISAITLLNNNESVIVILWVVAGAAFLMGVICVIASVGKRRERNMKIEEIKSTILEIESQFPDEQLKTE